jgi:hypothetical protein
MFIIMQIKFNFIPQYYTLRVFIIFDFITTTLKNKQTTDTSLTIMTN